MSNKIIDLTENIDNTSTQLNEEGFWKAFGSSLLKKVDFINNIVTKYKDKYPQPKDVKEHLPHPPTQREMDSIDTQYRENFKNHSFFRELLNVKEADLAKENGKIYAYVDSKDEVCYVDVPARGYDDLYNAILTKNNDGELTATKEAKELANLSPDRKLITFTFKNILVDKDATEQMKQELENQEEENEEGNEEITQDEVADAFNNDSDNSSNVSNSTWGDDTFSESTVRGETDMAILEDEKIVDKTEEEIVKEDDKETSGNNFKSNHKCSECGKPLDQCTCEPDLSDLDDSNDTTNDKEDNRQETKVSEPFANNKEESLKEDIGYLNDEPITMEEYEEEYNLECGYLSEIISEIKSRFSEEDAKRSLEDLDKLCSLIGVNPSEAYVTSFPTSIKGLKISMKPGEVRDDITANICSFVSYDGKQETFVTLYNKDTGGVFKSKEDARDFIEFIETSNGDIKEEALNVPYIKNIEEEFGMGAATQVSNIGQHKVGVITGKEKIDTVKDVTTNAKKDKYKGYKVMVSKYFPDEYEIYLEEDLIWGDIGTVEDGYAWLDKNM